MTEFDPAEFGRAMGTLVREAVAPLLKRIEELEARGAVQPADPEPVDTEALSDDVVSKLLSSDRLKTLADTVAAAAVVEYMRENPPKDGEDGEGASQQQIAAAVADYLRANPPQDGKSVTLEDVSLFLDAAIAKHVLELERRATDAVTRAIDKIPAPKDGKDGADFSEVSIDYDGERTITIKGRGGEIVKRVPIPLDRGYWSTGNSHEKGDVVTHNGVAFIAKRDTSAEPKTENSDDWRILARKGRDGKDGRNGIDKTGPVKL